MKLNTGLLPIKKDHRDNSFFRTFGTLNTNQFVDEMNVDAGLSNPNQNLPNSQFNIPALPEGCTDYTQSELCQDEDRILYNPILLENITHANVNGGCDIRVSLGACKTAYDHGPYYNVELSHNDWFDSIRSAIQLNNRSVSVGTWWFPIWLGTGDLSITKAPNSWDTTFASLHNHKICGWKTINGVTYLIDKPWIGEYRLVPRDVINQLLSMPYSGAFTIGPLAPVTQTVQLDYYNTLISYLRLILSLIKKQYGKITGTA